MDQILFQEYQGVKMLQRKPLVFFVLLCATAIGVFSRASWILNVYQDFFLPQNESVCSCNKCLMEYDPWLSELMKESPEPFLSPTNNISENTFNWWKVNVNLCILNICMYVYFFTDFKDKSLSSFKPNFQC